MPGKIDFKVDKKGNLVVVVSNTSSGTQPTDVERAQVDSIVAAFIRDFNDIRFSHEDKQIPATKQTTVSGVAGFRPIYALYESEAKRLIVTAQQQLAGTGWEVATNLAISPDDRELVRGVQASTAGYTTGSWEGLKPEAVFVDEDEEVLASAPAPASASAPRFTPQPPPPRRFIPQPPTTPKPPPPKHTSEPSRALPPRPIARDGQPGPSPVAGLPQSRSARGSGAVPSYPPAFSQSARAPAPTDYKMEAKTKTGFFGKTQSTSLEFSCKSEMLDKLLPLLQGFAKDHNATAHADRRDGKGFLVVSGKGVTDAFRRELESFLKANGFTRSTDATPVPPPPQPSSRSGQHLR